MATHFSKQQRDVLLGVILAYITAYLNRLNLSAALSGIMDAFSVSATSAGLLQTLFAVVYASGQMINGSIVDKIRPVRHMTVGLIGTSLCNFFLGLAPSYGVFLALCMFNGAFQSMLWTPIVRLIAVSFHHKQERGRANFFLSFSLVAGHFGAWAISGFMIDAVGWQFSFIVPALLAMASLAVVRLLLRSVRSLGSASSAAGSVPNRPASRCSPFCLFAETGFFLVLMFSSLYGFVRDGIITWSPVLLRSLMGESDLPAAAFSLIIPLINVLGIFLGYFLSRQSRRSIRQSITFMSACCAGFCLLLPLGSGMLLTALLLGISCACLYGANPLLTTLVPLEYDRAGRTGLAAGLIDSFVYIGSALAGVIDGKIYQACGVQTLYLTWALSAAAAAVSIFLAGSRRALNALAEQSRV